MSNFFRLELKMLFTTAFLLSKHQGDKVFASETIEKTKFKQTVLKIYKIAYQWYLSTRLCDRKQSLMTTRNAQKNFGICMPYL